MSRLGAALALVVGLAGSAGCARSNARGAIEVTDPRVTWQARVELAAGPAVRGPWRMNDSDFRWVDDAAIDLANGGEAAVAWVDQAHKDIFFQRVDRDGKARLPTPTNVSRSASTFSWLPRVVVAPDASDRIYLLWQEIVFSGGSHGGEIFFARTSDGGRTFTEPANLSSSKAGDGKGRLDAQIWDNGSLDLAIGPERDRDLYAAWTEYEGALWLRRSGDGGDSFSEAVRVAGTAESPARAPAIAVGPGGVVHVAWTVGEDPSADIRIASSADGGRSFGVPRTVGASEGHSDAPKLAVDRRGTVHLVYAESPTGRGGPYHVLYARSKSGADAFEPPRRISAGRYRETVSDNFPSLRVDAKNRVHVLWERARGTEERPRTLAFTYSTDGGDAFADPSVVPGIAGPALGWNGSQQGMLTDKLAVDAEGAIAIVNSTFDPGRASHVWLVRGRLED